MNAVFNLSHADEIVSRLCQCCSLYLRTLLWMECFYLPSSATARRTSISFRGRASFLMFDFEADDLDLVAHLILRVSKVSKGGDEV